MSYHHNTRELETNPMIPEWWNDEWAEETLNVVNRVYHIQRKTLMGGAYATPKFRLIEEDFYGYLIEKALDFRTTFIPNPWPGYTVEENWYAVLHSILTQWS